MSNERGAVIVAYGEPARKQAQYAVRSFTKWHTLPVVVISDAPLAGCQVIRHKDADPGARLIKLNLDTLSPFAETLYLDADTRANASLLSGFQVLQAGFDLVITHSVAQEEKLMQHIDNHEKHYTLDKIPGLPLQLQGGVFWFRKSAALLKLFHIWRVEWHRYQNKDQAALLRALEACDPKPHLWLFGRPYNGGELVTHFFGKAVRRVG